VSDSKEAPPQKGLEDDARIREHERYAVDWKLAVKCPDWTSAEQIATENISKGGMFLRTTRPVSLGARLKVTFVLPDGRTVEVQAVVRHCTDPEESARSGRPVGIGIEVEEESRNELLALVEISRIRQQPDSSPAGSPVVELASLPDAAGVAPGSAPSRLPTGKAAEIVGIDFGVTYSSVTVAIDDMVVPLTGESALPRIPSLVYFTKKGEPLVGWKARAKQADHPERTVASIKRILGRRYSDPQIGGFLQETPFKASAGPDDRILFDINGTPWAVPQIVAKIFSHLRAMAEKQTQMPVTRAVLTHPVTFDDQQKNALIRAASLAGIKVEKMVEEPVAAALAYGHGQGKNEIIAVYDFGGGTFDFTVIDMSGDHYRVLATEGDDWLGGNDFDLKLANALADAFWRKTEVELRHRVVEWQRLLLACEHAKCTLSANDVTEFEFPEIAVGAEVVCLKQRIERATFERLCLPLFLPTLEMCRQALRSIDLEPRDVTEVIAIGGSTRIPFIRRGLERFFDRKISDQVNVDDAVGLGAGVYAAEAAGHPVRGAKSVTE